MLNRTHLNDKISLNLFYNLTIFWDTWFHYCICYSMQKFNVSLLFRPSSWPGVHGSVVEHSLSGHFNDLHQEDAGSILVKFNTTFSWLLSNAVYLDRLSVAARTQKLVKRLFWAVSTFFVFLYLYQWFHVWNQVKNSSKKVFCPAFGCAQHLKDGQNTQQSKLALFGLVYFKDC